YRVDAKTLERKLLYQDEVGYDFGDISTDEQWIAFTKANTTNDNNLFLYDVAKKQLVPLTPHEGNVNHAVSAFHPNARWLYYLTDEGSEFTHVRRYEMASGKREDVESAAWDVMYSVFSHDGSYRVT